MTTAIANQFKVSKAMATAMRTGEDCVVVWCHEYYQALYITQSDFDNSVSVDENDVLAIIDEYGAYVD